MTSTPMGEDICFRLLNGEILDYCRLKHPDMRVMEAWELPERFPGNSCHPTSPEGLRMLSKMTPGCDFIRTDEMHICPMDGVQHLVYQETLIDSKE